MEKCVSSRHIGWAKLENLRIETRSYQIKMFLFLFIVPESKKPLHVWELLSVKRATWAPRTAIYLETSKYRTQSSETVFQNQVISNQGHINSTEILTLQNPLLLLLLLLLLPLFVITTRTHKIMKHQSKLTRKTSFIQWGPTFITHKTFIASIVKRSTSLRWDPEKLWTSTYPVPTWAQAGFLF